MNHALIPAMNAAWLFEAALRSLLMGVSIFAALKLLRIRQVRAQRTAWVLALLAALVMPALAHWPMNPQFLNLQKLLRDAKPARPAAQVTHVTQAVSEGHATVASSRRQNQERVLAFPVTGTRLNPVARRNENFFQLLVSKVTRYATAIYFGVTLLLLGRLMLGLGLALRLRRRATPAGSGTADDIRISTHIQTPVTIASSILLPASSAHWDSAKLRVVLAHERAHVQQSDFHVHLLAGLHCAIFWFSPFSWWLQHRLSALGEAMSDLAALNQAESRASYAEVLLEFATSARQPMAAVAMARSSNLRPRIERLLNERLFREACSGPRRHLVLAASIVPLALLASASLVRVHAASTANSIQAPVRPAIPTTPARPVVQPGIIAVPASPADVTTPPKLEATASPNPAPASDAIAEPAPLPDPPEPLVNAKALETLMAKVRGETDLTAQEANDAISNYSYNDDGDSFALVTGDGNINFSGRYDDQFKTIRSRTKGDFLYYLHEGKFYIIQDMVLIAQAKALYAPQEELGKLQAELGRKQEALGAQQEALEKQQESVKIPTPDLSKELASLDKAMQQMKTLQSAKELDQDSLSEIQGQIGQIQGRLGALQGEAGMEMGKFAAQQGSLGAQQGKLGAEQGCIGAKQGRLAVEAQRKLKPLIEQAIRDGRARPVE